MRSVYKIGPVPALAILFISACAHKSDLPATDSKTYREFCTAFYTGLAGLQSGEDVRAKDDLTLASQLAPGEPAVWANLAVFQLRRQEYEAALKSAESARELAAGNSRIEALLGQIQSKRGDVPECVAHFKKAISLDGRNLKAICALALETERQGNDADAGRNLEQLLTLVPTNTGVLLELARLSAKLGDKESLQRFLKTLQGQSNAWPDVSQKQLQTVEQAAGLDVRAAGGAQCSSCETSCCGRRITSEAWMKCELRQRSSLSLF